MLNIIPNYHPIMVHFSIALMVVSFGVLLLGDLFKTKLIFYRECLIVSRWCLWFAALASVFTVGAGFHAYYTVTHDTMSHKIMTIHRNWGIVSFIIIWLAAVWSFMHYRRGETVNRWFAACLAIAVGLVMITGWYGAELVFRYGLGVKSIPQAEPSGHQHTGSEHSVSKKMVMENDAGHGH